MARLPGVEPDEVADDRARAQYEDMIERMGEVTQNLRVLARKPAYVDLLAAVSHAIDAPTEIDRELERLVELKVARLQGCEYSIDLLEGLLLENGASEAKLHELDFHLESSLFDEREKLALVFTEKMVLDAVDDELFRRVRDEFSIVETLELVVTVGLESFYALVNRTLGLKPQGFRQRALAAGEAREREA